MTPAGPVAPGSSPIVDIREALSRRENGCGKLLIPFFTAGYPSLDATKRLALRAVDAGVDLIEIGMPFSDPLADGPSIQYSSQAALEQGVTVEAILKLVREVNSEISVPIVLMGYYNPILAFGLERFASAARGAGVRGLIIPDLPPEEAGELSESCRANRISLTFLAAPTSTDKRIRLVGRMSTDFVYAVTVTGVTGARSRFAAATPSYLRRVRSLAGKPVVAGFGVSDSATAGRLARHADGVVIGSALVDLIRRSGAKKSPALVAKFLRTIRQRLDRGE